MYKKTFRVGNLIFIGQPGCEFVNSTSCFCLALNKGEPQKVFAPIKISVLYAARCRKNFDLVKTTDFSLIFKVEKNHDQVAELVKIKSLGLVHFVTSFQNLDF